MIEKQRTVYELPDPDMIPIRDFLTKIMDERDRSYQQQFESTHNKIKDSLLAQEKAVMTAMNSAEKAIAKAEASAERRFDSVNEFRKTLSDQTSSFITRMEFNAAIKTLSDKMDVMMTNIRDLVPRTEYERAHGLLNEKIETDIKSVSTRIDDLKQFRDNSTGKAGGIAMMWAVAIGLTSVVVMIVDVMLLMKK